MRIVMTLIVRDEADVLEANLRAHRALGVDQFAVVDNGSTDRTVDILERWAAAGIAHVTSAPEADTREVFRHWQTRLARQAVELGADWVIHNDADEFWWPLEGSLRSAFESLSPGAAGVLAPRLEFVPRPDDERPWWERLTVREVRATVRPKLAHRAAPDVQVGPGSHHVASASLGLPPTAGRPSLRGLRQRPEQPRLIAPAADFPLAIWHFPLRSFAQYRRRLEIGMRIAGSTGSQALAGRIERTLEPRVVEERWGDVARGDEDVREAIERGELAEEPGLSELLARIGDVDPRQVPVDLTVPAAEPRELERRRAALREQAIAGMVHNEMQALAEGRGARASLQQASQRLEAARSRARERGRKLAAARRDARRARRELRATRRRLRRIERSRWWRLRPRLPRRNGVPPSPTGRRARRQGND